MNKKLNTILFVLGATAFNVIVAVVCFLILLILYLGVLVPRVPGAAQSWAVSVMFLTSIAASIAVYRVVLKFLMSKVDVEKYFDPIFVRKNIKKEQQSS